MNPDKAWQNFINTGKVQDYLLYRYENNKLLIPREEGNNENNNNWFSSQGNGHR